MMFIRNISLTAVLMSVSNAIATSPDAKAATSVLQQTRDLVVAQSSNDQAKANADEKLLISVDEVDTMVGGNDPCRTNYQVSATVVEVTKGDYRPGDSVVFNSYDIHYGQSGCEGYAGPSNPTQVTSGWCGNAWLDYSSSSNDPNTPLELAAYGDSLQADFPSKCATTKAPTMAPTPAATVQPYDELVLVEIITTFKYLTSSCVTTYGFQGTVETVEHTTVGFQSGDSIYFTMAHLNDSANCVSTDPIESETVPTAPWCGYVKLNDGNSMNPNGTFVAVDLDATSQDKCNRRRRAVEAPVATEETPATSDEVLLVSVVTVFQYGSKHACELDYTVVATVISVDHTTLGYAPGDSVTFDMQVFNQDPPSYCPFVSIPGASVPEFGACLMVNLSDGDAASKHGAALALDGMEASKSSECPRRRHLRVAQN
ncbi:expressed unknown protein [Seminavis robusta]|uniref:Uncharacterized protein n=1 Tax=Seminavis robusta TaxID=568900 RepID=A0A9N8HIJ0_9STRA|nr:expressed unknown protein [Seminavis robusta]|eukprot:Sro503_g155870.1 n/a (428) ;mRNA; r:53682-54965